MKKNWRTWIAGGAALTLLVGILTVPSLAAHMRRGAYLDYHDMSVTLDGKKLDLRDANGQAVEPFTINGTTYLPVAAIGEALGLDVAWDADTQTVVLTSGGSQSSASSSDYIGESRAKEIALDHAGLSASQVTFVRVELDRSYSHAEYEVEFWSGNKEYDYEIDAETGAIRSYDRDIEGYVAGSSQGTGDIGQDKAKEIALDHAGVSASDAVVLYAKLDYDDGRRVYEVEFYAGNKEYDYEIDAATGAVVSYDFDAERYAPASGSGSSGDYIGEAKAKAIVEERAGTTGTYREFHLERDDGRMVYEGELRSGSMEYEFQIDALTGTILEWESDRH